MEQQQEVEQRKFVEADWSELDRTPRESKFLKPVLNQVYSLTFKSVRFGSVTFKGEQKSKHAVEFKIATIDGVPSDKEWTSTSYTVMNAVRKVKNDIQKRTFYMKRYLENQQTRYIFDDITHLKTGGSPSLKRDDDVSAFL